MDFFLFRFFFYLTVFYWFLCFVENRDTKTVPFSNLNSNLLYLCEANTIENASGGKDFPGNFHV